MLLSGFTMGLTMGGSTASGVDVSRSVVVARSPRNATGAMSMSDPPLSASASSALTSGADVDRMLAFAAVKDLPDPSFCLTSGGKSTGAALSSFVAYENTYGLTCGEGGGGGGRWPRALPYSPTAPQPHTATAPHPHTPIPPAQPHNPKP